jgi:hypothetical protein
MQVLNEAEFFYTELHRASFGRASIVKLNRLVTALSVNVGSVVNEQTNNWLMATLHCDIESGAVVTTY